MKPHSKTRASRFKRCNRNTHEKTYIRGRYLVGQVNRVGRKPVSIIPKEVNHNVGLRRLPTHKDEMRENVRKLSMKPSKPMNMQSTGNNVSCVAFTYRNHFVEIRKTNLQVSHENGSICCIQMGNMKCKIITTTHISNKS